MIETHLNEKIGETLEQIGIMGRKAGKKLPAARKIAADALSESASSIRCAGSAIEQLAERTAAKIDSTVAFVRKKKRGGLSVRNGMTFAAGVAVVGCLLTFAVRRKWLAV